MGSLYTVGHSNLELDPFLDALDRHGIDCVVDVRSYPRSRYAPHFDRHALASALRTRGIDYLFLGDRLGGRSPYPDHYVDGQLDYVRLVASSPFREGLQEVAERAVEQRVALMCSEEDPLRCHRAVAIGRYYHEQGWQVLHIRASGELEDHTAFEARLQGNESGTQLGLWEPAPDREASYAAQGRRIAPRLDDGPSSTAEEG